MISFMMFVNEEGHDLAFFNVIRHYEEHVDCLAHHRMTIAETKPLLLIPHTTDRDVSVETDVGDKFTEYHFDPNKNERAMLLLKYLS